MAMKLDDDVKEEAFSYPAPKIVFRNTIIIIKTTISAEVKRGANNKFTLFSEVKENILSIKELDALIKEAVEVKNQWNMANKGNYIECD